MLPAAVSLFVLHAAEDILCYAAKLHPAAEDSLHHEYEDTLCYPDDPHTQFTLLDLSGFTQTHAKTCR